MDKIGIYDGYSVYRIFGNDGVPTDIDNLYVTSSGNMYFGRCLVGEVNLYNMTVIKYDEKFVKEIIKQRMETRKKSVREAHNCEVCEVAEDEMLRVPNAEELDKYFAELTKDIDVFLGSVTAVG